MKLHNILRGSVIQGDHIGRTIGYPTANLRTTDCLPENGVYVAQLTWKNKTHYGMLNIGLRPTIDGKEQRVEIHLLNFQGNLYGETVEVEILYFLRKERKFSSIDALREQLDNDRQKTQDYLRKKHLNVTYDE